VQIEEIRTRPALAEIAIDRIWRAWWKDKGHPVTVISESMAKLLASSEPKPFCLIAHANNVFVGTVSVIASDLAERPLLTPWVAALWVEPMYRRKGIASALLRCAVTRAFEHGDGRICLHCATQLLPFYEKREWTLFEAAVPNPNMCIVARVRAGDATQTRNVESGSMISGQTRWSDPHVPLSTASKMSKLRRPPALPAR
jgi:GNAT superfamily N-acetyltransferase